MTTADLTRHRVVCGECRRVSREGGFCSAYVMLLSLMLYSFKETM